MSPSSKRRLLGALALLTFAWAIQAGLNSTQEPPEARLVRAFQAQLAAGVPQPIDLTTLNDQRVELSTLRGQVVLVHFWATWCAPCREELPALLALANDFPSLQVLAVSSDEDDEALKAFFSGQTLPGNFQVGREATAASRFGTLKLPETYVVDRQGRLRLRLINAQPWEDERLRGYLRALAGA